MYLEEKLKKINISGKDNFFKFSFKLNLINISTFVITEHILLV